MKRLILLLGVVCFGASAFAQKNHQIFKFDNASSATEITTLGSNPQFPMLKGKASAEAEAAAIRKEGMRDDAHGRELNNLLMETGFANGAKDVKASDITASTIPAGSTGNMGNGAMGYQYVRLGSTNKAWKVTASNGNSIYFFGKCGNSFVPGSPVATACKDVSVNVISEPKTLTVEDAQASLVKQNTFIYYKKTCGAGNSAPLMLNTKDVVVTHPRTYKISVTGDPTARVCDDGTAANVNTSINVENMGSYGGFKKESKGDYKLVSKKVYDRAQKKLKKAQKKEDKVADMTHVQVHL